MKIIFLLLFSLSLFAATPSILSKLSMQELHKLMALDVDAGDNFGTSVAISGDTVIVGAFRDDEGGSISGSAYIYERNPSTRLFEQKAKLTASDAATMDYFGYSVAISGNTVIVGAYRDDNGSMTDSGSVYLFEKPLTGWENATQKAKLTALDAAGNDNFGISVAISGDTVIVGASGDDDGGSNSGSAYFFEKPFSGEWISTTQSSKITALDAAAGDNFGVSVAISGDIVIVGADLDDGVGNDSGSAYIYERNSITELFEEKAKLTTSDIEAYDYFGYSVAISADTVIVGAYGDDHAGSYSGSAYIFEKPSFGGWVDANQTTKLTALDSNENDYFGWSVAISGDTVIVGAFQDPAGTYSGSAYINVRNPITGVFEHKSKLRALDAASEDYFGVSVAISGDTVIVGASGDDEVGLINSGSAYMFQDSIFTNTVENKEEIIDIEANDPDGSPISFSIIGGEDATLFSVNTSSGLLSFVTPKDYEVPIDANSDNIYKMILQVNDSAGNSKITPVFVKVSDLEYEGNPPKAISFEELNELQVSNATSDAFFGYSVSVSDKTAVVGAYGFNSEKGTAYIYELNTTSNIFIQKARIIASDGMSGNRFGYSVAISGDTVVVGAYSDEDAGVNSGSVYLFEKPLTGWVNAIQSAKLTASDATSLNYFGYSVAISGDTVVVGAYGYYNNKGIAYLFNKPSNGNWIDTTQTAKLIASDGETFDFFGRNVAISGDTVIVGADGDADGGYSSGSVYLFEKPIAGWVDIIQNAKLTASDAMPNDNFGTSVAVSGDIVIIGADGDDDGGMTDSGSAYLFEKPLTGWVNATQSAKLTTSDTEAYDSFGSSVAISGNTVVVGAYLNDIVTNSGSAYLFEKPYSGWVDTNQTSKLVASDFAVNDNFAQSVSISGNTVIIGADKADDSGITNSGSAYIFKAKASGVNPTIIMYLLN